MNEELCEKLRRGQKLTKQFRGAKKAQRAIAEELKAIQTKLNQELHQVDSNKIYLLDNCFVQVKWYGQYDAYLIVPLEVE